MDESGDVRKHSTRTGAFLPHELGQIAVGHSQEPENAQDRVVEIKRKILKLEEKEKRKKKEKKEKKRKEKTEAPEGKESG